MSDLDLNEVLSARDQQAIDTLVRETKVGESLVAELYRIERAELERVAVVKVFVPLLASKHVKMKLPEFVRRERSPKE